MLASVLTDYAGTLELKACRVNLATPLKQLPVAAFLWLIA